MDKDDLCMCAVCTPFEWASMQSICAKGIMHSQKAPGWSIHKICGCLRYKACDPGDKFMNGQPSDCHLVKEKRYVVDTRAHTTSANPRYPECTLHAGDV